MSVIIADAARWLVLSGGQRAGQRAEPAMGNLLSVPEMAEGHRIRARRAPGEQAKESATATEAVLLLMQLPSLTEPSCVALLLLIALLLAHLGDARSMVPMWIFLGCGIVFSASSGIGVLLRAWQVALARIGRRRSRFRATSLERAKPRLGVPVLAGLTNSLVAHWAADC